MDNEIIKILRKKCNIAMRISISIFISSLIYGMLIEIIKRTNLEPFDIPTELNKLLSLIFLGLSIISVIFIKYSKNIFSKIFLNKNNNSKQNINYINFLYKNSVFISIMAETIGLYGFILFLLTRLEVESYLLIGISGLLAIFNLPKYKKWLELFDEYSITNNNNNK